VNLFVTIGRVCIKEYQPYSGWYVRVYSDRSKYDIFLLHMNCQKIEINGLPDKLFVFYSVTDAKKVTVSVLYWKTHKEKKGKKRKNGEND